MWIISSALLRDYENSRCSPEQAAEYSADTCSAGEPSAPLSGPHILRLYLPQDKMTDFSRLSRFGVMLLNLTEDLGQAVAMWSAEGFPVRTLAQPEKAQESTANAPACGRTWQGLLARYSPFLSLWRTPQCSLLEDSDVFSETWPRSGTMRNGCAYQRQSAERIIDETEYGFLPTPSGTSNHGKNHVVGRLDEWGGSSNPWRGTETGKTRSPSFEEWMMGWPVMWTRLMPYETDKFREWQQQHSLSFTGE